MNETTPTEAELFAKIQLERDLYRRLLELADCEQVEPFVSEALALIAKVSGAKRGYIELFDERDGPGEQGFWAIHGCTSDEAPSFRAGLSQGVITAALTTRETVISRSALLDPRFRERGSVRRQQIEAVLCVPIVASGYLGVIYLQGSAQTGSFDDEDRRRAETFARHVATVTDRLLLRRRYLQDSDPTLPFRRQLRAENFVGSSKAIADILRTAALAAPLDVGVLIDGPTGTGKSLLARIIHQSSRRAEGPLIELNCAALPEALLESELFGAHPGAYTGATRRIEGKVAAAAGGTLFLDEIGEIGLPAQAKLLQLLQDKEYYPLGSARLLKADVRIIAATNSDLEASVARKTFREDLRYRLEVLKIRMPALSEREDDIPELVRRACARACAAFGFPSLHASPGALRAAQISDWPGNVRQLQHAVETAAIRAHGEGAALLEPRHLFPDRPPPSEAELPSYQEATRNFQREFVRKALEDVGWNISEAARRLDLGRTYVHRLIAGLGLSRGER